MAFEQLLGNDRLKENLAQSLKTGHISHFYLISGPQGSGKHTLARLLSAAILCQGRDKPCGVCHPCRKVLEGNHPDVITIDDPEKKTVSVELIRQARGDIYIQPNEAERKIYIFPRAQDMGIASQNALLKVLEEPPAYGVFLLLTDNPEKILPTVRSRCRELTLHPLPQELLRRTLAQAYPQAQEAVITGAISRSGGYLGQAKTLMEGDALQSPQTQAFVKAYGRRDSLALVSVLAPMEKWKRDQLIPQLDQWAQILESALAVRVGGSSLSPMAQWLSGRRSPGELLRAVEELEKCSAYAQGNVSCGAICGYLVWALR